MDFISGLHSFVDAFQLFFISLDAQTRTEGAQVLHELVMRKVHQQLAAALGRFVGNLAA